MCGICRLRLNMVDVYPVRNYAIASDKIIHCSCQEVRTSLKSNEFLSVTFYVLILNFICNNYYNYLHRPNMKIK